MAGFEKNYAGFEKIYAGFEKIYAGFEKIYAGFEKELPALLISGVLPEAVGRGAVLQHATSILLHGRVHLVGH